MSTPPNELAQLVNRFADQHGAFRSGRYNETQVRREFIDPLFGLLGWDIDNRQGAPEAYKDVVHEDAIKVGGAHKAPDYSFRIGGVRKFFVEAKKPSVNLKDDATPAFQLRRYAWSANLPISILTDFEELAVYDCRIPPAQQDKASTARLLFRTFREYADSWDKLRALFSKEAVLNGSLEQYADTLSAKRGSATVDAVFLREIERWRSVLATNLLLRNRALTQRELNFAVQMNIDRIIFLRMAEDRGIEEYGRLQNLLNGTHVFERLRDLYRQADERYNSGLFHFQREKGRPEHPDRLTPMLEIDDEALRDIIANLYYPNSPYEFSVLPLDVLGHVYEQFLGKVIHVDSQRQVAVEEKPEVKKAGGVYYTPTHVVDYIVENTVSKLLKGKKRNAASKIRVIDPACGSGSFLIGAYSYLLDWHRDLYVEEGPQKHRKELYQGPGGQWLLTTAEKKRILLNNIYGVDIDPQAVEVTKLSLLLKVLEGESAQSLVTQLALFHERALPDLGTNIRCGNTLISPNYYELQQMGMFDQEERLRVNAFDWHRAFPTIMADGGFDVVVGNPPYDVMEKQRGAASWPHTALSDYVRLTPEYGPALGGKLNLFRFFIVRSLGLIRENGQFGMIVPLALLADISCARTRRYLMRSTKELEADCFPQKDNPRRRVFLGAKLSTVIVSARKGSQASDTSARLRVRVYPWNSFSDTCSESEITLADAALLDPENVPVPLTTADGWALAKRIHAARNVTRLGNVKDFDVTRGEINQTIYRKYITSDPTHARLLKGVEVGRFHIHRHLRQGHREWLDEQAFLRENALRPAVQRRRIATQRITGVDERLRVVATIIEPPAYFADSTNSIVLGSSSNYCLEYLLGLLNSRLFQWRFKLTSTNNNVGTNELDSLPFRLVDFAILDDKSKYDRVVALVKQIVDLYSLHSDARTGQDKQFYEHQIEAMDHQLDRHVYELYELTEEEIAVVANA